MKTEKKTALGELTWVPAPQTDNQRLGPDSSAMVDYLLHPPAGYPAPGGDRKNWAGLSRETVMEQRRERFQALVRSAFSQ